LQAQHPVGHVGHQVEGYLDDKGKQANYVQFSTGRTLTGLHLTNFADPMCSWCRGYKTVIETVRKRSDPAG
jgi:hypothetical protein